MGRNLEILLLTVVVLSVGPASVQAADQGDISGRWSTERACQWYQDVGAIKGCNYLPRSAVNMTEMWQAPTFDPKTVDQELGWAQEAGYNSVRVFLQYLVWKDDADGLKKRIKTFLSLANKHNISVMLILFCDCSFAGKEPYLGPQDDPVPGVHNSGWVPSPGLKRVTDRSVWPDLERYVKDIVGTFGQDPRILIWDLYNEPGNSAMRSKSLPLAEAAFAWAREVHPMQPLTIAVWTSFDSPMSKRIMALSDIISFHGYDQPEGMIRKIKTCRSYGRPVICTEWLRRQVGNTVASILPLFAKHHVGWYHWGLVAGRTQTYMHWGSKRGDPMPKVWQHDTFHQDGTPYDPQELELIQAFRFPGGTQTWNSVYLQNDCIRLQVVPECGGRVMQYSLGEHDFFWNNDTLINVKPPATGLGPDGQWLNYGGEKLWPAPQGWDSEQQWPGPPDAVLDGGPHSLEPVDDTGALKAVRLTSPEDMRSGIQFSRIIRCFAHTSRISIAATMKNVKAEPIRWGIWSHVQLDASNRLGNDYCRDFRACCPLHPDSTFHRGYCVQFGLVNNPTFKPDYENGMMHLHYQRMVGKVGIDSPAGWVATINGETGHVFVQRFTYEPDKAYPDDASVEFWSHGPGDFFAWGKINSLSSDPRETPYIWESEILSPYAHLAPGEEYTYHYDWYSAKVAPGAQVLTCNDVGVICEKLTATARDGRLSVKGQFGVFHRGYLTPILSDAVGNRKELSTAKIAVSPLNALDVSGINPALKGIPLPPETDTIELMIYSDHGKVMGKLTQAKIVVASAREPHSL